MNYFPRSLNTYIKESIVSLSISAIMILVFLFITQLEGPLSQSLNTYQAFNPVLVSDGEFVRLFAWVFIHVEALELFFSVLAMVLIGANLERLLGSVRFAVFFLAAAALNGLLLTLLQGNLIFLDIYMYGAAPSVASSIAAFLFIRLLRPRWFDDTDLRVLWVFITAYVIVIFSGFALGFTSPVFWVVYGIGVVLGMGLSFALVPAQRSDA